MISIPSVFLVITAAVILFLLTIIINSRNMAVPYLPCEALIMKCSNESQHTSTQEEV